MLKMIADFLQNYPRIWKLALKIYGYREINLNRLKYKRQDILEYINPGIKANYKIVFDAQCLQTLTRQRGIGSYSVNLIDAICDSSPESNFAAVLTNIVDKNELAKAINILQNLKCRNLDIYIFNPFHNKTNLEFSEAPTDYRLFLESLNCKHVLALSNFEKINNAIPLPGSKNYKRFTILYDLIPFQFPHQLLISRRQKKSYLDALERLENFDGLFSISNETKNHWLKLVSVNIPIKVIYGGTRNQKHRFSKNFDERFGIMCVGAELEHKNLRRMLKAYAQLPSDIKRIHPLTIVGIWSGGYRKYMKRLAKTLGISVAIPDYLERDALSKLYQDSRLLIMPSLVEGLSLPILDAWSHGLIAVGSENTVAEELIENENLLFDPYNIESMSYKMLEYLTNKISWELAQSELDSKLAYFTWDNSAVAVLEYLESIS